MFNKHGREPSWILQFNKYERLMMLALAEEDVKYTKELMKKVKKTRRI